ncbi:outer membrane beta-barrel protein [Neisseria meningitidis]|nr:opacity family porin [Neisseria meningitidis]MBH5413492.1 outer membrane beta-barrel protein [Neisseria meningitidis]MBH5770487.1 outer membrane beta-barrel protein [Neisseria meningitidis]MBH5776257.1 outer membrane beta-barrel protein [Neisseria meningitidis]MBH6176038.1 outer membrane beta-barrel protein [Neisseria meningitidis]MBH6199626.1 outer membrane beta-barrel protein [Neisseria meningitidis]
MNPAPKKPSLLFSSLLFSSLLFSSLLFSSLLFSSAAQAASEDGSRSPYYVQADLAYAAERITHDYPQATGANNTSTVSDYFRNIRAHSIHPRVSVGYDFGDWRIAADYASYRKWNNNKYSVNTKEVQRNNSNGTTWKELKTENQENGSFHAVSSLGLSAIYDFKLNDKFDKFKPYIGVRVAYGHVKHQVHSVRKETTTVFSKPSGSTTKPGEIPSLVTKPAYHESNSISSLGLGVIAGVGFDITPKLTLDTGYRYHNWGRLENTRFKTHEVSLGMRYHF